MSKVLNVGIVGTGGVAQVIHLPVLKSMPSKFRIAALCDVSEKSLSYNGQKYEVEDLYTDAQQLVKQKDLDAVLVLNSHEYHAEVAIAAANEGKHVLIEKPMALTIDDANDIIEAKNRNNVKMMVGYMRRFAPAFEAAVKEIGGLDKILYARVRGIIGPDDYFIRESGVYPKKFDDIPETLMVDKKERAKEMLTKATGGNDKLALWYHFLAEEGCHDLSVMREALGMPKAVAGAATGKNGRFLNVLFEYDKFNVSYETGIDEQGRFDAHLEVYGDSKSVRVEYDTPFIHGLPIKLIMNETENGVFKETMFRHTYKNPFVIELEDFHRVIVTNGETKTTPEDFKNDLVVFKMIMDKL